MARSRVRSSIVARRWTPDKEALLAQDPPSSYDYAAMDVRWKGRKRQQPGTEFGHDDVLGQDVRWTAVVVESVWSTATRASVKSRCSRASRRAKSKSFTTAATFGTLCMSGSISLATACRLMIEGASRQPSLTRSHGFRLKNTTQASKKSKSTTFFSVGLQLSTSLIGRRPEQAPRQIVTVRPARRANRFAPVQNRLEPIGTVCSNSSGSRLHRDNLFANFRHRDRLEWGIGTGGKSHWPSQSSRCYMPRLRSRRAQLTAVGNR